MYKFLYKLYKNILNYLINLYKNIDKKCLIVISIIYLSVFIWFYNIGFYNLYISWKKLGLI